MFNPKDIFHMDRIVGPEAAGGDRHRGAVEANINAVAKGFDKTVTVPIPGGFHDLHL
jgi:hypothetical protein